jgi:hypothetical protein
MKHRVIVFDDFPANLADVVQALVTAFDGKGEIVSFTPGTAGITNGPYEERLEADLKKSGDTPVTLIVADRDLSNLKPGYDGLSEQTVRRVADILGIPECGYARGANNPDALFLEEGEQSEAAIRLALLPQENFAKHVLSIADGFSTILERLPSAMQPSVGNSPGKILAHILGKPEYADKISLYASGDRNRLAAVARMNSVQEKIEKHRRLTCFFGYWLWDSVLRFPGVVLNEVAASSYLNIKQDNFQDKPHVQEPFAKARYDGPFAEAKGLLWWRGMLDDIVADSGFADGRELASKALSADLLPSECCEDPAKTAGYFCMVRRRPVSIENSVGGLSWFPRGADLARISRSANEEVVPWLTA